MKLSNSESIRVVRPEIAVYVVDSIGGGPIFPTKVDVRLISESGSGSKGCRLRQRCYGKAMLRLRSVYPQARTQDRTVFSVYPSSTMGTCRSLVRMHCTNHGVALVLTCHYTSKRSEDS